MQCIEQCRGNDACKWVGYRVADQYCEFWTASSCNPADAQPDHDIFDKTPLVTISTPTSLEMTIVAEASSEPVLTLTQGTFLGTWSTLANGVLQFSDRSAYTMSGIPEEFLGQWYFKGPCDSGVVGMTVSGATKVSTFASFGNSAINRNGITMSPSAVNQDFPSMTTTSFSSSPGFQVQTFDNCLKTSACPWGTTGTFETTGDCVQNSEITVSGHLVLKGVENAATLVKVTRGGGSSTQKRFFRLGHTTQERSLEISWLHFTGGRAILYGNNHGANIRNNAGFVLGVGSHYSLILRDSEVSDMQAQKGGALIFCAKVEWNDDGGWPVASSEVGKIILIYFDVDSYILSTRNEMCV